MMIHSNLDVNEKGNLTFAGMDTVSLAKEYGTPLYLMDEERIRLNIREYKDAMKKYMPEGSVPLYASKACSFMYIYKICKEENIAVDAVSEGEIYTALKAGFPMENLYFHGNNKSCGEIEFALDSKVGFFICDNYEELTYLDKACKKRNIKQKILLRLTPGIDPHTLEKINTGKVDSKFGTPIETGQAKLITEYALGLENIELKGFHCHVGSQVFDYYSFRDAARIMLGFISDMQKYCSFDTEILDLGGGFGVRYLNGDPDISYSDNIRDLSNEIGEMCKIIGLKMPRIMLEPGRSIVANAGITLYTVGNVKNIKGYKNYVAIDGGMTDNPRFALYAAEHGVIIASKASLENDFVATVAGKCCESGDLIRENVPMPKPESGDILAVLCTGAYNYSMASNYNRVPRPPVVMLNKGESKTVVKRETLDDLIKNDII